MKFWGDRWTTPMGHKTWRVQSRRDINDLFVLFCADTCTGLQLKSSRKQHVQLILQMPDQFKRMDTSSPGSYIVQKLVHGYMEAMQQLLTSTPIQDFKLLPLKEMYAKEAELHKLQEIVWIGCQSESSEVEGWRVSVGCVLLYDLNWWWLQVTQL